MNLGDELRSVLNQEADVQSATRPDLDRLISGGRARRRRRDLARFGAAALTLVLVGGGGYAITQLELDDSPGIADHPGPPDLPPDSGDTSLEPGTYRSLVGTGADGTALEADMTFVDSSWSSGNFPTVAAVYGVVGGLGVYRPEAIAAGSGCEADAPKTDLGATPQALAQQLALLPRSTVVQPVTPTQILGRDAQHLRLRIREDCPSNDYYRVAETPRGSRGISYGYGPTTVVIDFWVLDLDGVPVVVDAWHRAGTSADVVDEIARARDSISFVPGD
jgi:hypothetical protein